MYYYGYNGGYGGYPYSGVPCCNQGYAGYGNQGYGYGAAIWIVLFILLVIIIGAGWFGTERRNECCNI